MGAPIDLKKRLQTIDGRLIKFIAERKHPDCPLFGTIVEPDGSESLNSWARDGECLGEPNSSLKYVPIVAVVWVVVYTDNRQASGGLVYNTRAEADYKNFLRVLTASPNRYHIIHAEKYSHTIED